MLQKPHCGNKERLGAEGWREMAMMAPVDAQHRPVRDVQERRQDSRNNIMIRDETEVIERRQLLGLGAFNRKANANRDNGRDGPFSRDGGKSSSKQKDTVTAQDTYSTVTPSPTFVPIPVAPAVTTTSASSRTFSSTTSAPTIIPTSTSSASISSLTSLESPKTPSIATTTPPPPYPSLASVDMLSSWTQTASSSMGRKGLEPGDPGFSSWSEYAATSYQPTSAMTTSSSVSMKMTATAIGDTAAPTQDADIHQKDNGDHHKSNLSSSAAHGLIALGVIGAIILLSFIIYLVLRVLKVDVNGFGRRLFHRDDRAGSSGSQRSQNSASWRPLFANWRRQTDDEIPPPYQEAYAPEKTSSASPQRDLKFTPIVIPTTGTTPLVSNPAPFGASSPVEYNPSAGISYFITNPDRTTLMDKPATNIERNVSNASAGSNNATYYGTYDPNVPQGQPYNNQVRQSQGGYMGPNSRLSELSSLSSGFGDAKIDVPESGPSSGNQGAAPRKNSLARSGLLSRFSWNTNYNSSANGRDTVYTAASEESAPRFRSVTSWVNQQTSRVQRQNDTDVETQPMEPVARRKPPVTAAFQLAQARASVRNSRRQSQDKAFRAHPGEEVKFGRGSRVPSSILDGNFGGEEGPRYGRS